MARELKCPQCSSWNEASLTHCSTCGFSIIESHAKPKENEPNGYQKFVVNLKSQSGWIDRFFDKTRTSNNFFYKGLGYLLQFIWMVYFSLLLFIAWLVFIIAG